jgi:uncharacterized protein involved in outer membrane biogenesis
MDPLNKSASLFRKIIHNKVLLIALATMILYTLCGFFLAPYLVKKQLTQYVTEELGHRIDAEKIRLNPYTFFFEVEGLKLTEPDGSLLFSFDRMFVNFDLKGVFRWAWSFDEVRLDGPTVRLDIDPLGEVNWARLVAAASPDKELMQENKEGFNPNEGGLPRLIIEHIELSNGRIDFIDRSDPTSAAANFEPIDLTIAHLTTLAGEKGSETITITEPEGGTLEWTGKISLQPVRSEGQIVMRNWKPALIWRFLQDELFIKEPKGTIEASLQYEASYRKPSFQLELKQFQVKASQIALTMEDATEPFVVLDEIMLNDGRYDLSSNELTIGRLDLADGVVATFVDQDGHLNWKRLLEDRPARTETPDNLKMETAENQPIAPFKLQLNRLDMGNIALRYTDRSGPQPFGADLKRLNLSLAAELEQWSGGLRGKANNLSIDIADIQLNHLDTGEKLLEIPKFGMRGGQIDLSEQVIAINEILLSDGHINLWRTNEGSLNYMNLINTSSSKRKQKNRSELERKTWSVILPTILLEGFRLDLADRGLPSPDLYTMENINIKVTDFGSAHETETQVELDMEVAQGGLVKIKSTYDPSKRNAKAAMEVRNFVLTPLQPYLSKISDIILTSGNYSINGELQYETQGSNIMRFKGDSQIENLRIDLRKTEAPLMAWKALDAQGVTLTVAPNALEIEKLIVDQPNGKLIIKEDLTLNIRDAFTKSGKDDPGSKHVATDNNQQDESLVSEKKPPLEFPAKVKHIQIKDGKLAYADLSLRPRFAADIHDLNGMIVGLSTDTAGMAALELKGRVGRYGSADIIGELRPFDLRSRSDVKMIFYNVELVDFTPYSTKFAGRKIDSGRLSAEIDYQIRNSRLRGENKLVIDSLLLGDRVENSSASNLPLDLALALLKDSDGRIDLDLPVTGDLDHPEFSYGHLIWKAVVNVIEKVVTAPFRAIGNLLGIEHEELDQIFFAAGSAKIPPPESEKLAALAKGLLQRPQLGIKVQGRYQPESDGNALKAIAVKRDISVGLGYTLPPGGDPGPLDYTDTTTQAILEKMAIERRGSETVTALREKFGLLSQRTTPEGKPETNNEIRTPTKATGLDPIGFYHKLFTLIVEKEPLGREALLALAKLRTEAIISEMVSIDSVDHIRFSILDPSSAEKGEHDTVSAKLELTAQK